MDVEHFARKKLLPKFEVFGWILNSPLSNVLLSIITNSELKVGYDISQQYSNIGSRTSKFAYHKINKFGKWLGMWNK